MTQISISADLNGGHRAPDLNLSLHRDSRSVWTSGRLGSRRWLAAARCVAGAAGGVLLVAGLRRWSIAGGVAAGLGGGLAGWALAGGDGAGIRRLAARVSTRLPWRRRDEVEEASADSFPASDAPSWTPTAGTGVPDRGRVH